jgi:hypothetical protein
MFEKNKEILSLGGLPTKRNSSENVSKKEPGTISTTLLYQTIFFLYLFTLL